MIVTLERLQHADINLLRELRNANADAFFDDTYITREMQEDWWWNYSRHQTGLHIYSVWLNHVTPVGFLSVKAVGTVWSWPSIEVRELGHLLLAPAHRGRGIMRQAITEARRLYSPLTFWVAHVKPDNAASLKLFAAHEFIQLDPTPTKRQRKPKNEHSAAGLHRRP